MTNNLIKTVLILPFLMLLLCCQGTNDSVEYEKQIFLFAYLKGNQYLTRDQAVWLSYSQPLFEKYDARQAAISGANIVLTDSTTAESWSLSEDSTRKGFYFNKQILIKPRHTYQIHITIGDNIVTASTKVPPILEINTSLNEKVKNHVEIDSIRSRYPLILGCSKPDQLILIDLFCLESYNNAEYINPFGDQKYPKDEEEYDGGVDGQPRHIRAIAPLNALTSLGASNQYVIDWYSALIAFYGNYRLSIYALDENYNQFISAENPVYSGGVKGGLGVFASMTGKQYLLFVEK